VPVSINVLNDHLKPLCPRDDHAMGYEPARAILNVEHQPCYHCDFEGCPVRFDLDAGYYTVLAVSRLPYKRVAVPGQGCRRRKWHGMVLRSGWV
jgi:hypothetical protein